MLFWVLKTINTWTHKSHTCSCEHSTLSVEMPKWFQSESDCKFCFETWVIPALLTLSSSHISAFEKYTCFCCAHTWDTWILQWKKDEDHSQTKTWYDYQKKQTHSHRRERIHGSVCLREILEFDHGELRSHRAELWCSVTAFRGFNSERMGHNSDWSVSYSLFLDTRFKSQKLDPKLVSCVFQNPSWVYFHCPIIRTHLSVDESRSVEIGIRKTQPFLSTWNKSTIPVRFNFSCLSVCAPVISVVCHGNQSVTSETRWRRNAFHF